MRTPPLKNGTPKQSYQPKQAMSIDSVRSTDGKKPLGTNTVLAVNSSENSGETSPDEKRRAAIKLRYQLQESAQSLLRNQPEGKRLLACMVVRVDSFSEVLPDDIQEPVVVIERDAEMPRARYKNLVHCDSPWICPVCAQRRAEQDRDEVNRAYLAATAKGWIAVMVTYTQRHTFGDILKSLLEINAEARRWLKSGSRVGGVSWNDIKRKYGLCGGIINLEVTHGENAWHPHNHELLFIDPSKAEIEDMSELRWALAERWKRAVTLQGGDCDLYHGLHLRTGDDAVSEYLAKFGHDPKGGWSIESELTKGSAKIGKREGRTPFQLLYDYRFHDDKQAGALFVEFAREFAGKAHIRWSQGLRELLDIDNFKLPSELEIVSQDVAHKPCFQPMLALPYVAWKTVILKVTGRRAEFLIACEQGEIEVSDCLSKWGYKGAVYWLENRVNAKSAIQIWLEDYLENRAVNAKSALPQNLKLDMPPVAR